jgi:hypothetical protein
MNNFIQKLLDDIHNINPELSLKRQTEYNQNFINKALNEQCDIHVVSCCICETPTPEKIHGIIKACTTCKKAIKQ